MASELFTDTWGIPLTLKIGVSLTGATAANVTIRDPEGNTSSNAAAISDEAAGIVTYTTQQGDFTREGEYSIQVSVDFSASKRLRSKIVKFDVKQAL